MHWSGWVRIVAILVATVTMLLLKLGSHLPWYLWLPGGATAYVLTPIIIGIVWGMVERPQIEREIADLLEKHQKDVDSK